MKQIKVTKQGFTGIYYRESTTKRHRGKPDRCYYYTYKDGARKKHWVKVGWQSEGYSADIARDERQRRMKSDRNHASALSDKDMTLDKAFAQVLKLANTKKETKANDEGLYTNYLKDKFGHRKLDSISVFEVEELKTDILNRGKSPATARHVLVLLSKIYNKISSLGLWQGVNPVKSVKSPKFDNKRVRFLSKEEADLLLTTLKQRERRSTYSYDMALLSLHTGARLGEIRALRWQCIDLQERRLTILESGENAETKNKASRTAYITDELLPVLEKYERQPSEYLFTSPDGSQYKKCAPTTFRRVVDELFNGGVADRRQKVTFHTLRHTFASWLAIQGTPIFTIKELLGHKSIEMTMRYAKLAPDTKVSAVQKLFR